MLFNEILTLDLSQAVGGLGSFMLAVCAVPQCLEAWRTGHVFGLSWGFLGLWGGGEVLLLIYNALELGLDPWLTLNYGINLLCICYLCLKKVY